MAGRRRRTVDDLVCTEFVIADHFAEMYMDAPRFVRSNSPFYDGARWTVRRHGYCLNREAEWEYEPMPSSRDDEFFGRCRFDSLEEAVEMWNKCREKDLIPGAEPDSMRLRPGAKYNKEEEKQDG